jgi:hypothetical protein
MTIMLIHGNSILFTVIHVYLQGTLSIPAYTFISHCKNMPKQGKMGHEPFWEHKQGTKLQPGT